MHSVSVMRDPSLTLWTGWRSSSTSMKCIQNCFWSCERLEVRLQNETPFKMIVVLIFFLCLCFLLPFTGVVLDFSCPHGAVYFLNFLFWTESARDHVDGLLSFKAFPICFISDVSGQVARHMNNRSQQMTGDCVNQPRTIWQEQQRNSKLKWPG